jgi:hypothetical protein
MQVLGNWSTLRSVAAFCLVIGVFGACSDDDGDGSDESSGDEPSGQEDASVFEIAVGDCLSDDVAGANVEEVPTVPCDQPHTSEVYFTYNIEEESFPSPERMDSLTEEQCMPAFESFIGMPYDDSEIEVTTLEPTAESWEQGDRELVCMVVDPAGEVTGSLEGANR